jgi:hypothetical protein
MGSAWLGDAARTPPLSTAIFRGRAPQLTQALARGLKAAQVAALRHRGHGAGALDTTPAREGLDHPGGALGQPTPGAGLSPAVGQHDTTAVRLRQVDHGEGQEVGWGGRLCRRAWGARGACHRRAGHVWPLLRPRGAAVAGLRLGRADRDRPPMAPGLHRRRPVRAAPAVKDRASTMGTRRGLCRQEG